MMAARNKQNRTSVSPVKKILVAVLGVVFVAVVISNFVGAPQDGGLDGVKAVKPPNRRPMRAALPETEPARTVAAGREIGSWPEMDVETVASFDPFRLPRSMQTVPQEETGIEHTAQAESLEQDELVQLELQRQELQRRKLAVLKDLMAGGVSISLVSDKTQIVQIGDRHFRPGDTIGGFRIKTINKDGSVVIEAIE